MWFDKQPSAGDRALVILARNERSGILSPLGSYTINSTTELYLAECVICDVGNEESSTYPGASFLNIKVNNTLSNPASQSTISIFSYPSYMRNAIVALQRRFGTALDTAEKRAKAIEYLIPVPYMTPAYSRLLTDIRGDSAVPASARAVLDETVQWFNSIGMSYEPLPSTFPVAITEPGATANYTEEMTMLWADVVSGMASAGSESVVGPADASAPAVEEYDGEWNEEEGGHD